MIWIIDPRISESYKIIGINLHKDKSGMYQLWATKPSGKTILLMEDEDEQTVIDYGDAINYAIANNITTFTIG